MKTLFCLSLALFAGLIVSAQTAKPTATERIPLWPGKAPNGNGTFEDSTQELEVFLPAADKAPADTPSQQSKMKTCNADAKAKGLKGDERKAFMSECLKAR